METIKNVSADDLAHTLANLAREGYPNARVEAHLPSDPSSGEVTPGRDMTFDVTPEEN